MNLKKYLILAVFLPLILSGCFLRPKKSEQPPADKYQIYNSGLWNGLSFSAKALNGWRVEESSSGKFGGFKDKVLFAGNDESIEVSVNKADEKEAVLKPYTAESQSQTEVDGTLGDRFSLATGEGETASRFEEALLQTGDYLLVIKSSTQGSPNFTDFLYNFAFTKLQPGKPQANDGSDKPAQLKSDKLTVSLYFINSQSNETDCKATAIKKVIISRPENDLGLIPDLMKLLIQLSQPEALPDKNISSAIPINTRILSYGYDNNKAIVNFNGYLNESGGSCMMAARRSQIEKTLRALNEVSSLRIKSVEIQVEGDAQTALQP